MVQLRGPVSPGRVLPVLAAPDAPLMIADLPGLGLCPGRWQLEQPAPIAPTPPALPRGDLHRAARALAAAAPHKETPCPPRGSAPP